MYHQTLQHVDEVAVVLCAAREKPLAGQHLWQRALPLSEVKLLVDEGQEVVDRTLPFELEELVVVKIDDGRISGNVELEADQLVVGTRAINLCDGQRIVRQFRGELAPRVLERFAVAAVRRVKVDEPTVLVPQPHRRWIIYKLGEVVSIERLCFEDD